MRIRVAVCDSARARYFHVDKPNGALQEQKAQTHQKARQKSGELNTDQSGHGFSAGGGFSLGSNDASKHEAQVFAREVADHLNREALSGDVKKLYILAPPEFLGLLRPELHSETQAVLAKTSAVNVVKEEVGRIRRHLPDFL